MHPALSQRQRIVAALIYIALMWVLYQSTTRLLAQGEEAAILWFFSGALMVVLGRYVVEPFYTTPADAIVNALTLLITLGLLRPEHRDALVGSRWLMYYGLTVLGVAILSIFLKDATRPALKLASRASYRFAEALGKSHVIFSALYLLVSYSYLAKPEQIGLFVAAIAVWICVVFFDVAGKTLHELGKVFSLFTRRSGDELGEAIGCDNPLLYKVEVNHVTYKGPVPAYGDLIAIETGVNVGSVGMIVGRKYLLGKSWLDAYLLTDAAGSVLKLDLHGHKLVDDPQSIFASTNKAFLVNAGVDLPPDDLAKVLTNPLYAHRQSFVGYVTRDSDISRVSFIILRSDDSASRRISEAVILKTAIYGEDTLYQVINGSTREEHLQGLDSHGYTVGIARKLGHYNPVECELETRKWMPSIYSPLFFGHADEVAQDRIREIADRAIGRLPDTDLEVRLKDVDAVVTHNTAILGILGIGKSCLAYDLIKRVTAAGIKVVCIDVTNEYRKELPSYVLAEAIACDDENAFNSINAKFGYVHTDGTKQVPEKSGNSADYKAALGEDLRTFLFGSEAIPDPPIFEPSRKVRIYNVDYHKASRGEKIGFNVLATEMTQAEKTRVIAEELFKILMKCPLEDVKKAKVLLVFEEAHSLIPEWNSVANDGDRNATNGTAKIILQGRKYGLGSMIVTQRTANVSKSILNQCNTIFALRVFDDTGKQFLENYIGQDYAQTLATLEERHAIAIGKGMRLKQPVIIRLNERAHVETQAPGVPAAGSP